MSENREPTRIVYEKTDRGATIEMRGTNEEIITGLVRLISSASKKTGFSADRFAIALPALIALDDARIESSQVFDFSALRREKEGGK